MDPITEHASAIGSLAMNFSALELVVRICIRDLLSADPKLGDIAAAPLSFRVSLDVLSALFDHRIVDDDAKGRLRGIVKRAHEIEEERNKIMHSAWVCDNPDGGPLHRLRIKLRQNGLTYDMPPIGAEAVRNSARAAVQLLREFAEHVMPLAEASWPKAQA